MFLEFYWLMCVYQEYYKHGLRGYQEVRGRGGGGEGFKEMAELECWKRKGLCILVQKI